MQFIVALFSVHVFLQIFVFCSEQSIQTATNGPEILEKLERAILEHKFESYTLAKNKSAEDNREAKRFWFMIVVQLEFIREYLGINKSDYFIVVPKLYNLIQSFRLGAEYKYIFPEEQAKLDGKFYDKSTYSGLLEETQQKMSVLEKLCRFNKTLSTVAKWQIMALTALESIIQNSLKLPIDWKSHFVKQDFHDSFFKYSVRDFSLQRFSFRIFEIASESCCLKTIFDEVQECISTQAKYMSGSLSEDKLLSARNVAIYILFSTTPYIEDLDFRKINTSQRRKLREIKKDIFKIGKLNRFIILNHGRGQLLFLLKRIARDDLLDKERSDGEGITIPIEVLSKVDLASKLSPCLTFLYPECFSEAYTTSNSRITYVMDLIKDFKMRILKLAEISVKATFLLQSMAIIGMIERLLGTPNVDLKNILTIEMLVRFIYQVSSLKAIENYPWLHEISLSNKEGLQVIQDSKNIYLLSFSGVEENVFLTCYSYFLRLTDILDCIHGMLYACGVAQFGECDDHLIGICNAAIRYSQYLSSVKSELWLANDMAFWDEIKNSSNFIMEIHEGRWHKNVSESFVKFFEENYNASNLKKKHFDALKNSMPYGQSKKSDTKTDENLKPVEESSVQDLSNMAGFDDTDSSMEQDVVAEQTKTVETSEDSENSFEVGDEHGDHCDKIAEQTVSNQEVSSNSTADQSIIAPPLHVKALINFKDLSLAPNVDPRDIAMAYILIGNHIYEAHLKKFIQAMDCKDEFFTNQEVFESTIKIYWSYEPEAVNDALIAAAIPDMDYLWSCIDLYKKRMQIVHQTQPRAPRFQNKILATNVSVISHYSDLTDSKGSEFFKDFSITLKDFSERCFAVLGDLSGLEAVLVEPISEVGRSDKFLSPYETECSLAALSIYRFATIGLSRESILHRLPYDVRHLRHAMAHRTVPNEQLKAYIDEIFSGSPCHEFLLSLLN